MPRLAWTTGADPGRAVRTATAWTRAFQGSLLQNSPAPFPAAVCCCVLLCVVAVAQGGLNYQRLYRPSAATAGSHPGEVLLQLPVAARTAHAVYVAAVVDVAVLLVLLCCCCGCCGCSRARH